MDNYGLNETDLEITGTEDGFTDQASNSSENIPPAKEMFRYNAAGKEIEEDRETVLKRASMGYHYAQNMEQLKADRANLEAEQSRVRESENKWSAYDTYSNENPEWASHVKNQWENRNQFGQSQDSTQANVDIPPALQGEMQELRQFRDEFKGFMSANKREKEDAELNGQIDSTRKSYEDIDFSYSDPTSGKTLEFQVLEHMQVHGLNNFRAAFRDFYYDKLLAREVTKAKEETAKGLQERQRNGYLAESDTPVLGIRQPNNIKNKSYFDLIDEGIKELGIN